MTISIHALCEEGDVAVQKIVSGLVPISIHALCEEGDIDPLAAQISEELFLSTPSARRATITVVASLVAWWEFLSTPSARRATCARHPAADHGRISIHALCEEGDAQNLAKERGIDLFLSTPSARRATRITAGRR